DPDAGCLEQAGQRLRPMGKRPLVTGGDILADQAHRAVAGPHGDVAPILPGHQQQVRARFLPGQRQHMFGEIRLVEARGDGEAESLAPERQRGLHFRHVELEEDEADGRCGHDFSPAARLPGRERLCNPRAVAPKGPIMIRRALTNTGWLMGARGINAVLSLGYLAMATRALGLHGFGQFILCVTFAQAVTGLASFQTWQAVIRWGQRKETVADAVGFALALDLLTVAVGSVAAALLLEFAGSWLPVPPELRSETFALTLVFLLAVRSTPTGILRLYDRYAQGAAADSVTSIVRIAGCAIAVVFAPSITSFILVWALAEAATAAAYWRYALRRQPLDARRVSLARLPRVER